jgi:hypothetical protein
VELIEHEAREAAKAVVSRRIVATAAQVQDLLELASKLVSYGEFATAAGHCQQARRELLALDELAEAWRAA